MKSKCNGYRAHNQDWCVSMLLFANEHWTQSAAEVDEMDKVLSYKPKNFDVMMM